MSCSQFTNLLSRSEFFNSPQTLRFQTGSLEVCRQLTVNGVQVSNSKNSHRASWRINLGSPQPALEAEEHYSTKKNHQENQQQEPDARRSSRGVSKSSRYFLDRGQGFQEIGCRKSVRLNSLNNPHPTPPTPGHTSSILTEPGMFPAADWPD